MKILFLSQEALWPTGIGTYTTNTARAMAARGHEVHILSCVARTSEGDEHHDGVWVHRRRRIRIRGSSRVARAPMVRELVRLLSPPEFPPWTSPFLRINAALSNYLEYRRLGIDFDIVEAPDHLAEGLLFTLLGATPVVVELHGPVSMALRYWGYRAKWHLRMSDRLERMAVRRATLIIAPSRLASRELDIAGWRGAGGAVVVPHTIDGGRTATRPASETEPVVLSVGEIGSRKASDVLVRAAAKLVPSVPGIELSFVGPSYPTPAGTESREVITSLAEKLGVTCRFGGYVPREEMIAWYDRARVVALPSRFDPFGLAGLEALAAGRPVVCSTQTGLSEIADQAGGAVVVVPSDDPDALAAAMQPLLEDPRAADELGRRGRAFVADRWGPEIGARREEAYRMAIHLWKGEATPARRADALSR